MLQPRCQTLVNDWLWHKHKFLTPFPNLGHFWRDIPATELPIRLAESSVANMQSFYNLCPILPSSLSYSFIPRSPSSMHLLHPNILEFVPREFSLKQYLLKNKIKQNKYLLISFLGTITLAARDLSFQRKEKLKSQSLIGKTLLNKAFIYFHLRLSYYFLPDPHLSFLSSPENKFSFFTKTPNRQLHSECVHVCMCLCANVPSRWWALLFRQTFEWSFSPSLKACACGTPNRTRNSMYIMFSWWNFVTKLYYIFCFVGINLYCIICLSSLFF